VDSLGDKRARLYFSSVFHDGYLLNSLGTAQVAPYTAVLIRACGNRATHFHYLH
jgi:hypothetical protein